MGPLAQVARRAAAGDLAGAAAELARLRPPPPVALAARGSADPSESPTTWIEWTPNGRRVGVLGAGQLRVFEAESFRQIGPSIPLDRDGGFFNLSPSGALAFVQRPSAVTLHALDGGEILLTLPRTAREYGARALSPDERLVAYLDLAPGLPHGLDGNAIALWDVERRAIVRHLVPPGSTGRAPFVHAHWGSALSFSRDGRFVTMGFDDGRAREWEAATGAFVRERPDARLIEGPEGLGVHVPVDPDPRTGENPAVPIVRDLRANRDLGPLEAPDCPAATGEALFGPPGAPLVTLRADRQLCLWDLPTRTLRAVVEFPSRGPIHRHQVGSVVTFTPDGSGLLVSLGRPHDDVTPLRLFDAATGKAVRDFPEATLVGVDDEGAVLVHEQGKQLHRVKGALRVPTVSPTASLVGMNALTFPGWRGWRGYARAEEGHGLSFLDAHRGQVARLPAEDGYWCTRADPARRWLIGVDERGDLRAWDLLTREPRLHLPASSASLDLVALRVSDRGDALAFATELGAESRLSLLTGELTQTRGEEPNMPGRWHGPPPSSYDAHVRGVALGGDARVRMLLRDPGSDEHALRLPGSRGPSPLRAVVPSPAWIDAGSADGHDGMVLAPRDAYVATFWGSGTPGAGERLRLFLLPSGREVAQREAPAITGAAFDPRGGRLAIGDHDGLRILALPSLREVARAPGETEGTPVYASDGALLAWPARSEDKDRIDELHLFDVSAGRERCRTTGAPPLAFSRDGRLLASRAAGGGLAVARTADCAPVATFPLEGSVTALAYLPDGTLVALLAEGQATFLDPAGTPTLVLRLAVGAAAAFSPTGRVELLGDPVQARRLASCQVEGYVLPFELCEARFAERGILAGGLARDRGHGPAVGR